MERPRWLDHPADPAVWRRSPPHATLDWLQAYEPVSWWDDLDGRRGHWLVTRWRDVIEISHDPVTFSSRFGVVNLDDLDDEQLDARRTMLEEDPPRHSALRRLIDGDFLPRAVRAFEGSVRLLTETVLARVPIDEPFDLVHHVSEQVPIRVLCEVLGVPDAHVDDLVQWGNQMLADERDDRSAETALPGDDELRLLPFGHPAARQAFALADALIAERRQRPTADVTSKIVHGMVDGRPLSPDELRTMWLLLVIAGNETTRHTITHGLLTLLEHPDLLRQWRSDRRLDDRAVEEVLRTATPINWHRRTATRPVTLRDRTIQAGDKILLSYAAANRDPTVFTEPDRIDLARNPNPHVSFGRGGPHFCVGAHLARLEVRIVLITLLDRLDRWEIVGPIERLESNHLNGFRSAPVRARGRRAVP